MKPQTISNPDINRSLLQLTTPETGNGANNGFNISSFLNKDVLFLQQEQANFLLKGAAGGITIAPNGNIGMGTDLPKQKLHIHDGNIVISKPYLNPSASLFFGNNTGGPVWGVEFLNSINESSGLDFCRFLDESVILDEPDEGKSRDVEKSSVLFLHENGKVGIDTKNPQAKLDVNGSLKAKNAEIVNTLTANLLNAPTANITDTLFTKHLDAKSAQILGNACLFGKLGVGTGNPSQKLHVAGNSYFDGNVGIGKATPQAKLHVLGDVCIEGGAFSLSVGNACFADLNWGTSYIGFNAKRNNETWTCAGDGAHNGGGVIYTTVSGDIYFVSIPHTGTNAQTFTDTQIKSKIKMHLNANGVLKTKDVMVSALNWPDFVFEQDYNLPSLIEVEQYIKQNHRLPNVPSAAEVETEGINLGEMNALLIRKIEEMTLYILDLQKQINELKDIK